MAGACGPPPERPGHRSVARLRAPPPTPGAKPPCPRPDHVNTFPPQMRMAARSRASLAACVRICRGSRPSTSFSGGKLLQDVPDHAGTPYGQGPAHTHDLEIDPASRLGRAVAGASPDAWPAEDPDDAALQLQVNTFHHQAVMMAALRRVFGRAPGRTARPGGGRGVWKAATVDGSSAFSATQSAPNPRPKSSTEYGLISSQPQPRFRRLAPTGPRAARRPVSAARHSAARAHCSRRKGAARAEPSHGPLGKVSCRVTGYSRRRPTRRRQRRRRSLMARRSSVFVPLSVLEFRDRAETYSARRSESSTGQALHLPAVRRADASLANALVALGIEPGDRVSFLTYNTHQLLELLRRPRSGAVPEPHQHPPQPGESRTSSATPARRSSLHKDFKPLVEALVAELRSSLAS